MMLGALLSAWSAVVPLGAVASMEVPSAVQAVMFRKIVGYDSVLGVKKPEEVVVCIAYQDDKVDAEELAQAFRTAGLKAAAIALTAVPRHVQKVDMLYIFNAKDAEVLKPLLAGVKLLTVSGDATLATAGTVTVALAVAEDGKPKIFVNTRRMQAEGHVLSASLLGLATVIKE